MRQDVTIRVRDNSRHEQMRTLTVEAATGNEAADKALMLSRGIAGTVCVMSVQPAQQTPDIQYRARDLPDEPVAPVRKRGRPRKN